MKPYRYETSCVESDGPSITAMAEAATDVSYRTVLRRCEGLLEWAVGQGYKRRRDQGLTLRNDWCVSYHRSRYRGRPCYYLCWSSIEFVWVLDAPHP
jgi:hypothetical protein